MDEVLDTAADDAEVLVAAGFRSLMVENFGDVPFFADDVPAETVAAMALAVSRVAETGVAVGVNVLRNDAMAALGIAAATGARFVRVNVITGVMYTDQGPIVGKAAQIARARASLAPGVEVWADVMVKHAVAPPGTDPGQMALETIERAGADALIVSGAGTGAELNVAEAQAVRDAMPDDTRLVAGSGVTADNLDRILGVVDTVIVGSNLKVDGDPNKRPDRLRVAAFVEKAKERGLT